MNQNRNKDNDLQRAIDEITQKGGSNGAPKAAPAPMASGMPQPAPSAMKLPQSPAPQMGMPTMPATGTVVMKSPVISN